MWEESYGYVGIELLAAGVPVLGNARGGILDYVEEGRTGRLNRDASAAGLAELMADVIEHPEQLERMNAHIRAEHDRIVKHFDDHARELEAVYDELIAGAAARREALAAARHDA